MRLPLLADQQAGQKRGRCCAAPLAPAEPARRPAPAAGRRRRRRSHALLAAPAPHPARAPAARQRGHLPEVRRPAGFACRLPFYSPSCQQTATPHRLVSAQQPPASWPPPCACQRAAVQQRRAQHPCRQKRAGRPRPDRAHGGRPPLSLHPAVRLCRPLCICCPTAKQACRGPARRAAGQASE